MIEEKNIMFKINVTTDLGIFYVYRIRIISCELFHAIQTTKHMKCDYI